MADEDAIGLRWSIKRQFLAYVARMPDGRMSVSGGASTVGDDEFLFAPAEGSAFDVPTRSGLVKFRGDVRFAGHYGFLFVRVADPWLAVEDGRATMTIAGEGDGERTPFVTLTLRAGAGPGLLAGDDVRLTEQGSEIFNSVYPPGERFEDLTVSAEG